MDGKTLFRRVSKKTIFTESYEGQERVMIFNSHKRRKFV